jgi:hypothetical protein
MLYDVLSESSPTMSKKNAGLTYSILAAISFKTVSLGTYTAIPSFFSHASKAPWKSFSLMLSSTACDSLQMPDTVPKCRPFSFIFNLGNKAKSQGTKSGEEGGCGTITMLMFFYIMGCGVQTGSTRHVGQ